MSEHGAPTVAAKKAVARRLTAATVLLLVLWSASAFAQTPVQVTTRDGKHALSFGVLGQGLLQFDTAAGLPASNDFCFRRLRFIGGGKVANKIRLFVDTDVPYLGEHNTKWSVPPTYLQDLIVTWEASTVFQVDAGLLLVPASYNGTQSAASLLVAGYSPYSFLASTPTHSRVGRDQGVQARGYLAKNHVEYRAGAYRGARKDDASMPFRYVGRVVWYPYGAQTNFFYNGTMHGKRKLVGIGASMDRQAHYASYGADVFGEFPLPSGGTLTVQADYIRYDGNRTFLTLPRQHTWMAEAAYTARSRIGAFAQVAGQNLVSATRPDAGMFQCGALYWVKGHRQNLKVGVGRTYKDHTPTHTQVLIQSQVFIF